MFLETINNEPLVSHIVIAQNTQRQPIAIQNLIVSNKADFEEFGTLHFKNEGVVNNGKGEQPKTYYLNEPQATLLLTYLRNSDIVKKFKKALVKEFYALRERITTTNDKTLNLIASAMQTMLNQNGAILELLKQSKEPIRYADKPDTRLYHKKLSNEEKFIAKVISTLEKEEGLKQGELLERVGKRSDDKTAKRWLHGYDGIYWRANILNAVPTYSYSLIEE